MQEVRLKLSPPWVTYINKIKALFGEDPDINIQYDNFSRRIKLFVNDPEKASCLFTLLPVNKKFD